MKLFKRLLMVFAFSLPFFLVSNTEAGKGVKKNNLGLNTRSVSGTIIGTNPVNKSFVVRSCNRKKEWLPSMEATCPQLHVMVLQLNFS